MTEEQTEPHSSNDVAGNEGALTRIEETVNQVKSEISKVVVGQEAMVDLLLAGMLTGSHTLIEGVPGIAKTLTARMLARSLSVDFSRIQFTPDLMPSDVLGTNIYNMKTSEFEFHKGPIFSNIVLIDEVNRSPAKTQAALFEVMEEKQASIEGQTLDMDFPFFVVATQNPIEQEGTYKLPEAQLDRFLFRIQLTYPGYQEEVDILNRFEADFKQNAANEVNNVLSKEQLREFQDTIQQVHISDDLVQYIATITHYTRNNADLFLGASPRATLALMKTAKAIAAIYGRNFVIPEDVQFVAYPVMNHRLILAPEKEMEGFQPGDVIREILEQIEVPR